MRGWCANKTMWLLKISGAHYEIRGVPKGPVLVASKHQSMLWDTIIFTGILDDPAVGKYSGEIAYYGWFSKKAMRSSSGLGRSAVTLVAQGKAALTASRPIVIFPEGSRGRARTAPGYKPGVAALYRGLGVACVPVAVQPVYWPRRPGFCAAPCWNSSIRSPPGLDRRSLSWPPWKPAPKPRRRNCWPKGRVSAAADLWYNLPQPR